MLEIKKVEINIAINDKEILMLLKELWKDVHFAIKDMRMRGLFTRRPKTWGDIKRVSVSKMERRYKISFDEFRKNVRLLRVEDLWVEDDKKYDADKFAYIVTHRFDYKVPIIFLVDVKGYGIYLIDTEGSDRIEYAVKLEK